ncbi:hypothetical protein PIB30_102906 [Stylosanthes scabra]|uniref:Uncharacterized protein n=1 Tax=Stylosanthes scabra TaxID=79078 RepID=A0ABU6TXI1_9FABA|nr:hypothetical protein [Stylosanthes scabra]
MANYRWRVGTVNATKEDFREAVTSDAVYSKKGIRFQKSGTKRLRSVKVRHTCKQVQRVSIMHSKWLGKEIKKKVENNPKVKIKEIVAKTDRKWNLTVSSSMAARSRPGRMLSLRSKDLLGNSTSD